MTKVEIIRDGYAKLTEEQKQQLRGNLRRVTKLTLDYVLQGMSGHAIAEKRGIDYSSVEFPLKAIVRELDKIKG
jgi:transposase-like protein